jgi:hypothetical protein
MGAERAVFEIRGTMDRGKADDGGRDRYDDPGRAHGGSGLCAPAADR